MSLNEILDDDDSIIKLWNDAEPAAEREVLPAGTYQALIISGEIARSRGNSTPSFKVTISVVNPAKYAGRKLYHDYWLTPNAIEISKRELKKIGITEAEQLKQPFPGGVLAEAVVVRRTSDKGAVFNKVVSLVTLDNGDPSALAPDDDKKKPDTFPAEHEEIPF
jgi:hypothetical protein